MDGLYWIKDFQSCRDFIDDDGKKVTVQESMTAFARYFSPLLDPAEAESRADGTGDAASIHITHVSVDDLRRAIRLLKPSSPAGARCSSCIPSDGL